MKGSMNNKTTFKQRIEYFMDDNRPRGDVVIFPDDIRRLIVENMNLRNDVKALKERNRRLYLYGVTG
jgi:hypothetical protein